MCPWRTASRIMWRWTTRWGEGDGTSRRQPRPASSLTFQPSVSRRRSASSRARNGPIGLLGSWNAGSASSTTTCVTTVTT